jgi:purine-binding chemotaxis protein CheW
VVVDGVSEVLRIAEDSIEPPSPLVSTVDSTFITGIAKYGERLIILLDLSKVLSLEEQSQLQVWPK